MMAIIVIARYLMLSYRSFRVDRAEGHIYDGVHLAGLSFACVAASLFMDIQTGRLAWLAALLLGITAISSGRTLGQIAATISVFLAATFLVAGSVIQ